MKHYKDTICVAKEACTTDQFPYLAIQETLQWPFNNFKGVIGLAYQSDKKNSMMIVDVLHRDGVIDEPTFAIMAAPVGMTSKISFGHLDESFKGYQDEKSHEIARSTHNDKWLFNMKRIKIGKFQSYLKGY